MREAERRELERSDSMERMMQVNERLKEELNEVLAKMAGQLTKIQDKRH